MRKRRLRYESFLAYHSLLLLEDLELYTHQTDF
jgi:hypothetical protein